MSGMGEGLVTVAGEGVRVAPPPYSPQALNGAVPIRVKTERIDFTDGYEGNYAIVRLNVQRRVMDEFRSGDFDRLCGAVASIVTEWNLANRPGEPVLAITAEAVYDLPDDLFRQLVEGFTERFNAFVELPKASRAPSATTPTTSGSDPTADAA